MNKESYLRLKELDEHLEQARNIVKQLEEKYDELQNKINNIRWRAEIMGNHALSGDDNIYYYVLQDGKINWNPDNGRDTSNYLYSIGNYFKTREEAERYKKHLIITQQLKDIALRLNDGQEIDWSCENQKKYSISYHHSGYYLKQNHFFEMKELGQIYCLSPKFLETARKEIGEQELIEYIKES